MSSRILFCLALVLGGGLFGCSTRHIPIAPSAEQVRAWAGFPSDFQLRAVAESVTNQVYGGQPDFGKPIWECTYNNPERSLVSVGIAIYQRGTLWGTNHTQFPIIIEQQIEKMRTLKDLNEFSKKADQIVALPNGRKAYFTVLGFGPGAETLAGFSYERDYDLVVTEDFATEHGVPAEKQIKNPISPANDLASIFGMAETFFEAQQKMSGKP